MDSCSKICKNCGDHYCCHGICEKLNDFLIKKKADKARKNWKHKKK